MAKAVFARQAAPRGAPTSLVVLSVLALAAVGCSDDPALSERELSGTVFDLGTGDTLEDARVTFTSETLLVAETTTGGDGRYELQVQTASPFGQVRAERAGYEPAEATVFFDTPSRAIDLRLRQMRSE